jgi:hypothetical protein
VFEKSFGSKNSMLIHQDSEVQLKPESQLAQRDPVDFVSETLLGWFEKKFGNAPIVRAREEFFSQTGNVFPEDQHYSARIAYFLDYFLFSKNLSGIRFEKTLNPNFSDKTVLTLYYQDAVKSLDGMGFEGVYHSLFEVIKHQNNSLICKDLFSQEKVVIDARPNNAFNWISAKDIFQAHLYLVGEKAYLGDGIIFHSAKTKSQIVKTVKKFVKAKMDRWPLYFRLAQLSLRVTAQRGLDPAVLYKQIV